MTSRGQQTRAARQDARVEYEERKIFVGHNTPAKGEYMKTASVHPSPETVRVHTKKKPGEKEEER